MFSRLLESVSFSLFSSPSSPVTNIMFCWAFLLFSSFYFPLPARKKPDVIINVAKLLRRLSFHVG